MTCRLLIQPWRKCSSEGASAPGVREDKHNKSCALLILRATVHERATAKKNRSSGGIGRRRTKLEILMVMTITSLYRHQTHQERNSSTIVVARARKNLEE